MTDIPTLRTRAETLFRIAIEAADPAAAVHRALLEEPLPPLGRGRRREIIAIGKAGRAMASAARENYPDPTLVITNDGSAGPLEGAEVLASGHPVPDARGEAAAARVLAKLEALGEGDQALMLISGGGSALLPSPVAGVSLEEKATLNRLLLASGADIVEMNMVRQQLSRTKGGGLLRAAVPAQVRALILSDVVGDDLRVIASGPTASPIGTAAEARRALEERRLWDKLPDAIRRHLMEAGVPPSLPVAENRLIGSNAQSVAAMAAASDGRINEPPLTGDVADAAARIWAEAESGISLWGGETTVFLRGQGKGGRNQELALRVACVAEAKGIEGPWVFLSGGTDGRDGPTDAAGGIVDHQTLTRMREAGVNPAEALATNDSYTALARSGDLLMTGATGTNVADVQIMIRP